jgi:2-C-methyl-D-erythritol 4-phosphate cytidylyltransferase
MAGMNIAMIPGDEMNFKITTKQDLERFEQVLKLKA